MSDQNTRKNVEKTTIADIIHTATSFALSFIPSAGELFNLCIMTPAERRRNDWIESIGREFYELKSTVPDIMTRIQNNEQAISAILTASPLALKTHNKTKL